MLVCVFKIVSEATGPTEAKFHVEPQWDRGGKFIQKIPVICCSSFEYCQSLGAGAFRVAFTTNVVLQCRAFSRALEIEKLKATLFRGPKGAGDTNDWCIKSILECLIIMRIWYGMFRSLNITGTTLNGVFGFANGLQTIQTGPRTLHLNSLLLLSLSLALSSKLPIGKLYIRIIYVMVR